MRYRMNRGVKTENDDKMVQSTAWGDHQNYESNIEMNSLTNLITKGRNLIPLEKRNKTLVYLLITIGTSLDNLIISGSLTCVFSISESFPNAGTTTISWVLSSYALTLGAFIIISGKLADVLGPHNVFLFGLFFTSIFALVSAVIVDQIIVLIVFRAIQGAFAASTIPAAFALTGNYFSGKALTLAIKGLTMALTTVFGIGCILGGAFSESAIGYKGFFYCTSAVGFIVFIALYFTIISIKLTKGHEELRLKDLDFGGSIGLVVGLSLVILGLTEGGESWSRLSSYIPLIIGILLIIGVLLFEMIYIQNFKDKVMRKAESGDEEAARPNISQVASKSVKHRNEENFKSFEVEVPEMQDWRYKIQLLFPREVIKVRNFTQYLLANFLFYMVYISSMTTVVQYYQYIRLETPLMASVRVLPMALGLAVSSWIYRDDFAIRVGKKNFVLAASVLLLGSTIWISFMNFQKSKSFWKYECFPMFFIGFATNSYFQVYLSDIISGTPLHLQGIVTGILQTAGQIGICFGNTIIASMNGDYHYTLDLNSRERLHKIFRKDFFLAIGSSAALFLVLLCLKKQPRQEILGKDVDGAKEENHRLDSKVKGAN